MFKKIIFGLLLCASLLLGHNLRSVGYSQIPESYIILDEHTNVWHGISLRKTGIPTAWSILGFYLDDSKTIGAGGQIDGFNLSVDGKKPSLLDYKNFPKPVIAVSEFDFGRGLSHTRFVQPYIDHPPFGAYILSLFVSKNATTFADVSNYDLRRSAIFLGVVTQILIFILALLITKKPLVGLIASTIYATVPSYLLLSRYALLENVLSPLVLLSLILLLVAKNKAGKLLNYLLIIAGVIAGLGALTKLVGWVFILFNVFLLYHWKFKFKEILAYFLPAFFVGILYFVWGLYLSPKLFIDLFLTQTSRDFIGSINMIMSFFRVNIYRFPIDGWWVGGFVSLLFIPKDKKYLPIIIGSIAVIISALCVVGSNYPWYFIPLIPFMSIATVLVFYNFARLPSLKLLSLIFFTFISSSFYWGYGVHQQSQPFMIYRLLFFVFLVVSVFIYLLKDKIKNNKFWYIGVMVLLVQLFALNKTSFTFILENWGRFPLLYTPGSF